MKPDKRLADWWVENPFLIVAKGKSLSGYERNRVYLNSDGKAFHEISGISGADSDGDGRAVFGMDFNEDGMEDLVVRQAGGGSLILYENKLPRVNSLHVSLRGTKSNRLGIGARLVAEVAGHQIVRELYPVNSYLSQAPARVHFGLGLKSSARLRILLNRLLRDT